MTAIGLWVLVKLPQECWIHIAQRDFTDTVSEHPWFGVVCAVVVLALVGVLLLVVRPRLPDPDWGWRIAADPLVKNPRRRRGVRWGELAEKAALLALLSVVFAAILPTVEMSALEIALGAVAIVGANAAISTWYARAERSIESHAARFVALLAANLGFVYLASRLLSDVEDFPLGTGLFFAFLITLLISLYDVYKPMHDARFAGSTLNA